MKEIVSLSLTILVVAIVTNLVLFTYQLNNTTYTVISYIVVLLLSLPLFTYYYDYFYSKFDN